MGLLIQTVILVFVCLFVLRNLCTVSHPHVPTSYSYQQHTGIPSPSSVSLPVLAIFLFLIMGLRLMGLWFCNIYSFDKFTHVHSRINFFSPLPSPACLLSFLSPPYSLEIPFSRPYLFVLSCDTLVFNQDHPCGLRFGTVHWNLVDPPLVTP